MFDLQDYEETGVAKEIDLPIPGNDGIERVLHLKITAKSRKREAKLYQRYFMRGVRTDDNEFASAPELLDYAQAMATIVKDSTNLFTRNGEPIPHTLALIKLVLEKEVSFAVWFANAVNDLFREQETFLKQQEAADEKNS